MAGEDWARRSVSLWAQSRHSLSQSRNPSMVLTSAGRWSRAALACVPPVGAWSTAMPVVATSTASRNTTAYSNRARARGPGPAVRRMVSRMTTAAARAMVQQAPQRQAGGGVVVGEDEAGHEQEAG